MSYRDDLEAAQARADALARDNTQLREEKADLVRDRAAFEQRAAADRAELELQLQRKADDENAAAPRPDANLPLNALVIVPSQTLQPVRTSAGPANAVFLLGTVAGVVGLGVGVMVIAGLGFALAAAAIHRLGSR